MSPKTESKLALKNQKTKTRTIIAQKLGELLSDYKKRKKGEEYQKMLTKASKVLSKAIVVPLPSEKSGKKMPAKKSACYC